MSTPTPGPWSFDGPDSNIHVRKAADPNMRVCFMTSDGPTRANAMLIAAAPDLLAALKMLHEIDDDYGIDLTEQQRDQMHDALAKAEGRAMPHPDGAK